MAYRKICYLQTNLAEKNIVSHGIEFKDFLGCLEKPLKNILLIKHEFAGASLHSQSGFDYVSGGEIEKLAADDIYNYGDFSWVDFEDEFAPDKLTRLDIAELLYFGHKEQPFSSPVFTRLQNRFAYASHDDGWYTSIYFNESSDMLSFINCAVSTVAYAKHLTGGKLPPETAKEILSLSEGGLLLDAGDIAEKGDMVELPFYVTGKIANMDDAENNTALYKKNTQKRGTLRFKKKADTRPVPFWHRSRKRKK